jgi:hypothetical protein
MMVVTSNQSPIVVKHNLSGPWKVTRKTKQRRSTAALEELGELPRSAVPGGR